MKFKKLDQLAPLPAYKSEQAAGMDLYLNETVIVSDNVVLAKTGLSAEIPQGYFGLLVQRSSMIKYGVQLANSVGIIDSDYRGEILVPLVTYKKRFFGLLPKKVQIDAGERVAQLVILPCNAVTVKKQHKIEEVSKLESTKRDTGGFGSTGKN